MPKAIHNCIPRPCRLYLDRLYNFVLQMQFTLFLYWSERSEKKTFFWVLSSLLECFGAKTTKLLSVVDCGHFCN